MGEASEGAAAARLPRPRPPADADDAALIAHYRVLFDDDPDLTLTWVRATCRDDPTARAELATIYVPLVRYVVSRMNIALPASLERGDLVGFGTLGLIDAIGKFDIDLGLTFQTYAVTRIRGAILDELRSLDWVPRAVRTRMHAIDRATEEFEQEHGAEPSIDDLSTATGLASPDVRSALTGYRRGYVTSLDERLAGDSSGEQEPRGRAFVDETAELPEEIYDHEESRRVMREQIRALAPRDRAVVALYYFEELTFGEIGQVLGVSESRACQLHGRAIKLLREQSVAD
jgi:RNA polymerase sigma factor for flagellar operon FliA